MVSNMKFAHFDTDGFPVAFFAVDVHGPREIDGQPNPAIPAEAVEITDDQWQEMLANPGRRRWLDGALVEHELPPVEIVTILYPADLWRRTTDDEAEQIDAAMQQQPLRIRRIFNTASSYRSDDDLWPMLTGAAETLFGAVRAAELLAPSA